MSDVIDTRMVCWGGMRNQSRLFFSADNGIGLTLCTAGQLRPYLRLFLNGVGLFQWMELDSERIESRDNSPARRTRYPRRLLADNPLHSKRMISGGIANPCP